MLLCKLQILPGATFIDSHTSREGKWYLVITVNYGDLKDALNKSTVHSDDLLQFLRKMKQEYRTTASCQEIYFKNPPSQ
ncbi:MAG: hypothetical protein ACJAX3_000618 [Patiriisocius sp.]|jgi:hypothetical protein